MFLCDFLWEPMYFMPMLPVAAFDSADQAEASLPCCAPPSSDERSAQEARRESRSRDERRRNKNKPFE